MNLNWWQRIADLPGMCLEVCIDKLFDFCRFNSEEEGA